MSATRTNTVKLTNGTVLRTRSRLRYITFALTDGVTRASVIGRTDNYHQAARNHQNASARYPGQIVTIDFCPVEAFGPGRCEVGRPLVEFGNVIIDETTREINVVEDTPNATVCPECGGEIQATVKVYFSLVDGEWEPTLRPDSGGVELYCESDHNLDTIEDHLALSTKVAEYVAHAMEEMS